MVSKTCDLNSGEAQNLLGQIIKRFDQLFRKFIKNTARTEECQANVVVDKLKIELALEKTQANLCDFYKCESILCKVQVTSTRARELKTILKMVSIVDNKAHWTSFYLKRTRVVFLKIMNVAEELERVYTSLGATSLILPEDVRRYVGKIQAILIFLVREEKEYCEPD